ncbi:MAG TPA: acylphosphatase [Solirubrobacterales bacterium]|nr:acylphosphatase [Solirubrobacterales bacterium]
MEASEAVRRRVVAHGQVQGVFFRASLKERAEQYGVAGWARNRADGSMEACFEGQRTAVEAMVSYCADGPEKARVTRLDEIEEDAMGIRGFRVR